MKFRMPTRSLKKAYRMFLTSDIEFNIHVVIGITFIGLQMEGKEMFCFLYNSFLRTFSKPGE